MRFLIILFVFVLACSSPKEEEAIVISAEALVEEVSGVELHCPEQVFWSDGKLITINNCGGNAVQVIDLQTKSEQWLGTFGDGPDEIGSLASMVSFDKSNGVLVKMLDTRKRSIFTLFENDGEIKLTQDQNIPEVIYNWYNFIELRDGSIVYNNLSGEYNMSRYLPSGDELFVMDFLPDIGTPNQGVDKAYDYYNHIVAKPDGSKIVQVLQSFPFMIAYDADLNLIELHQTQESYQKPDFSISGANKFFDLPQYILEAHAGEDYFYVVNPNATYEQTADANFAPIIEIYNWDMELQATLSLDRLLGFTAIDFDQKKIYGLAIGEEELVLANVDIPRELHQYF